MWRDLAKQYWQVAILLVGEWYREIKRHRFLIMIRAVGLFNWVTPPSEWHGTPGSAGRY